MKKREEKTLSAREKALLIAGRAAPWAIGLALSLGAAAARGLRAGLDAHLTARYLSDGFFTAGFVLTGIGLLSLIASTGFFDMFAYGFHSLLVLFSALRKPADHADFYTYKQERAEKRRKPKAFILPAGIGLLLLSGICLLLYYRLTPAA